MTMSARRPPCPACPAITTGTSSRCRRWAPTAFSNPAGRPTWRCSTSTIRAASDFPQGTKGPAEGMDEGSLHDPSQSPAQRSNRPAGTSRYITSIRHTGGGEPWERQRQTRARGLRPLPPSANDQRSSTDAQGNTKVFAAPATGHSTSTQVHLPVPIVSLSSDHGSDLRRR